MTKYFLNSISIEGFRGINNQGDPLRVTFVPNGVTSFFGENGMGKSSIFEALLFTFLGRIIRFDDYHRDIVDKRTIKNLFHNGNGQIELEIIDDQKNINTIQIVISQNGERTIGTTTIANPEIFLSNLCNNLNFLDYKSFEKIMLTSSEETGKLFSNLVGLGEFTKIKDKLDKISRTQNINSDFGKATKENLIQTNNKRILELENEILTRIRALGIELKQFKQDEINKTLKSFIRTEYSKKVNGKVIKTKIDFDELIKSKIGDEYEKKSFELNQLLKKLDESELLYKNLLGFNKTIINKTIKSFDSAYKNIKSQDDIILGRLYDEAIKSYDSKADFDRNSCILCLTSELERGKNTFYEQINVKISNYKKFKNHYEYFIDEFKKLLESKAIFELEKKYKQESERLFTNIINKNEYLYKNFFHDTNVLMVLNGYKTILKNDISKTKTEIKTIKKSIPPKLSELIETHNTFNFVYQSLIGINSLNLENNFNSNYLEQLQHWINYIEKLKNEFEEAYNVLMDEIATMIDIDTKEFFAAIMGNVDIKPKIMKENKGQKVNILLEKFHTFGSDIKAATILSESYRNALCLSIYFATALKSKNPGHFIIVDDITSSFDSGHQFFLLDLIKNKIAMRSKNKGGKQFILLTHDGTLKKTLNENNNLPYWKHYNLFANKDSVTLKQINSDELEIIIRKNISTGNYLGSDCRMFYEKVLLEIIEKLNLEIPYSLLNNNDEKMINKLILAIGEIIELKRKSNKINKKLNIPNRSDFKTYVQQLANNLSHWASASSLSLTPPVLNKIIDDIDSFKKRFQYNCTCSNNSGWVYYKSLSSPNQKGCTCTI